MPTFLDLAGAQEPPYVDGRSLEPVLDGSVTSWRSAILLEAAANYSPAHRGIRTVNTNGITRHKYVEYSGGARELYDLSADPYERTNRYNHTTPPHGLASRLHALESCGADAAVACRTAENGPQ
jgi:N-acetylglucosamine-6-sulfatase